MIRDARQRRSISAVHHKKQTVRILPAGSASCTPFWPHLSASDATARSCDTCRVDAQPNSTVFDDLMLLDPRTYLQVKDPIV